METNNKWFHVETVEQYKILQFINRNFKEDTLILTLLNRYEILGTDKMEEALIFYYDNGEIKTKDVMRTNIDTEN